MRKTVWLRNLFLLDAAVLFWLGGLLVVAPRWIEVVFHFNNLPPGVSYLVGLWGCVFLSLGVGYTMAARDPLRHIGWAQIGIIRGLLECLVGLYYLSRGTVTFSQAGVGIVLAGAIAVAYLLLYPRQSAPQVAAPENRPSPAA
ncbi:MAG TPA: hypothetical protein VG167_00030 [Verrucomicrobiae bacterium]|nr:hypothetical protein [Verrucomicrobiae bacterium]